MKTEVYYWTLIISILCSIKLLLFILFPTTVYALTPDDKNIETVVNSLPDYIDLYAVDHSGVTYYKDTPEQYWRDHMSENDAYAINQKNIYIWKTNEKIPYLHPQFSPYKLDYESTRYNITKTVHYKSKFVWYVWKKYTKQYDTFKQFEKSLNNSFSIRNQIKKDIKRNFKK